MANSSIRDRINACLRGFLNSTNRHSVVFNDSSNLLKDLGLTSDEGIDFALELCEILEVNLPVEFNPFIHQSGERGCTVSEMISRVELIFTSLGVNV